MPGWTCVAMKILHIFYFCKYILYIYLYCDIFRFVDAGYQNQASCSSPHFIHVRNKLFVWSFCWCFADSLCVVFGFQRIFLDLISFVQNHDKTQCPFDQTMSLLSQMRDVCLCWYPIPILLTVLTLIGSCLPMRLQTHFLTMIGVDVSFCLKDLYNHRTWWNQVTFLRMTMWENDN